VVKDKIGLKDLADNFSYFHVKIEREFLKAILERLCNNEKPHYNLGLIESLDMKLTKGVKYCTTIYGWISYDKTIRLEKLKKIVEMSETEWEDVETKIISIKSGQAKGEIRPVFPIEINRGLGSIIGHILGDGSIDVRYKQIAFSNSNKELLEEFRHYMKQIFGIEPRIWMQKKADFGNTSWDRKLNRIEDTIEGRNCSLFYPTICGLILNNLFDNFAVGKNKYITRKIMSANKNFKIGLIRAIYDDEGSVDKRSYIRIFQDRKEMLALLKKLLEEFEISSSEIFSYIKRNKQRYYFNIYGKKNFTEFQNKIGFTSRKKSERLDNLIRK